MARPVAASSGKIETIGEGSLIASRRRRPSSPVLRSLFGGSNSVVVTRAASDNLDSALVRIEKLEAENKKLRELLSGNGERLSGDEEGAALLTSTSTASSSSSPPPPSAAPVVAAAAAAAPLPTSLQFQAAEQDEEPAAAAAVALEASLALSSSSSPSVIDASNVAWPQPGEPFWKRSPRIDKPSTKTATTKNTNAPSPPPTTNNPNEIIVHVAAELAPRAKVGGLGDVVAGLARECATRGQRTVVILPFYECLPEDAVEDLELVDEFSCPKGKSSDGGKISSVEQLGVRAFSGMLDGIEVLLLRPDWDKTNLFRGGRIYGGSYNEAEA